MNRTYFNHFTYTIFGRTNFDLAYSLTEILAGIIVYAPYFYAKRNPELVDKTVPPLIGIRAGSA